MAWQEHSTVHGSWNCCSRASDGHGKISLANECRTCTCSDGYVTRQAGYYEVAPCRLAPAYTVSGASNSAYNGRYERLADEWFGGAPVYQLGGSGGSVLYRGGGWYVGSCKRSYEDCDTVFALANCEESPDEAGCVGQWQLYDGHFSPNSWDHIKLPNFTVTAG